MPEVCRGRSRRVGRWAADSPGLLGRNTRGGHFHTKKMWNHFFFFLHACHVAHPLRSCACRVSHALRHYWEFNRKTKNDGCAARPASGCCSAHSRIRGCDQTTKNAVHLAAVLIRHKEKRDACEDGCDETAKHAVHLAAVLIRG